MKRAQRKLEHIKYALEIEYGPGSTHFEDLNFVHNCLPEINPADITLSAEVFGKKLAYPFIIDAITGGTEAVTHINEQLAVLADKFKIAMAVGSQYGAVKNNSDFKSYEVVRKINPDGIIFANTSALATPKQAQSAIDMINADAIEIHLNPAQEIFMPEGDKNFVGLFDNILRIRDAVKVPVIIKETGCGIAKEEYAKLSEYGFKFFNCAGRGGTNFTAIEACRAGIALKDDFLTWGNPTCWSLIDGALTLQKDDLLIASGGIDSAGKAVKAFALGADLAAAAGTVLRILIQEGLEDAERFMEQLMQDIKIYMCLLGCHNIHELRNVPLIFKNETVDYMQCRNYDIHSLCIKRR